MASVRRLAQAAVLVASTALGGAGCSGDAGSPTLEIVGQSDARASRIAYRISLTLPGTSDAISPACQRKGDIAFGTPWFFGPENFEFSLHASRFQSLHASTECRLSAIPTTDITSITIQLGIPGTVENCQAFCRAEIKCSASCAAESYTIYGERTLPGLGESARIEMSSPLKADRLSPGQKGPPLPDLSLDPQRPVASMNVTRESFDSSSCAMKEACLTGTGMRTLLRFDTKILNQGSADLMMGRPEENPGYALDQCHGHYHLAGVAKYELLVPSAISAPPVAVGRKQGFCLEDIDPIGSIIPASLFDCDFQGIHAGWGDLYESSLDCQWLDITDIPPAKYLLRLTVNPERRLPEWDYSNNTVEIPIEIADQGFVVQLPENAGSDA